MDIPGLICGPAPSTISFLALRSSPLEVAPYYILLALAIAALAYLQGLVNTLPAAGDTFGYRCVLGSRFFWFSIALPTPLYLSVLYAIFFDAPWWWHFVWGALLFLLLPLLIYAQSDISQVIVNLFWQQALRQAGKATPPATKPPPTSPPSPSPPQPLTDPPTAP